MRCSRNPPLGRACGCGDLGVRRGLRWEPAGAWPAAGQGRAQICAQTGVRRAESASSLTFQTPGEHPKCAATPSSAEGRACAGGIPVAGTAHLGRGRGAGGARDPRCGLPAPGPILGQYCPGGARCCPVGHGPGVLCCRLSAAAEPAGPVPPTRGRGVPGAGHPGRRRARPAGAGSRLPAVPGSRTAGPRYVHPSRERPPAAAGPRPPLPLPRRGGRGTAAPLALPRGRSRLPGSRCGPDGAPHLRVDASEAEPARDK